MAHYYDSYDCECHTHKKNLYQLIKSQCDLQSLTEAVDQFPPIKEALETVDPLTVFGPTNRAFKKFNPGETCGSLDSILLYHVVPQFLPSCKLENDTLYSTLREGEKIRVNVYERPIFRDVITVNGAKVVEADLKAKNGMLHKIDSVLCPPDKNILELALATPELSTLVVAVQAASPAIADALANADPLTLFAPNNEAFADLDKELRRCYDTTLEDVLQNQPLLDQILLYHVLGQTVFKAAIKKGLTWGIQTLQGETIDLKNKKYKLLIRDALCRHSRVVKADVLATNGVVHIIDRVLLPTFP